MSNDSLIDCALKAIIVNRSNLMIMHERNTRIEEDVKVGLDAIIAAMGETSIRKDKGYAKADVVVSPTNLASSEIRVLNDEGAVKTMLAACEGLEDLEDCMRAAYHALDNEEYLRTTKPVSVSLNKCLQAYIKHVNSRDEDHYTDSDVVKAVLDAAGVKYVD